MNEGKMSPRIEVARVPLGEKIPLATPYSVTINTCTFCNFACTFCPCRTMQHKAAIMDFDLFKHVIDNAGFSEQVKVLHMYNIGEPLLNKNLERMISYAKEKKFSKKISMVSNASLMTKERAESIINTGIDRIIISLYGLNDDDYKKTTQKTVDYDKIYENIKYINSIKGNCEIFVKTVDRFTPTNKEREKFIDDFKNNSTFYSVETILPIWPNFRPVEDESSSINLEDINRGLYEGVPAAERLACHYPFYSMVVNPTGKVNPCLADWDESLILGDTQKNSLNEIWNGAKYQEFRFEHLIGRRPEHFLCKTCGTLKVATPEQDDINPYRLDLLERLFPEHKINN